tara:strand:- start:1543 stop:1791 length:249 start_codon:yes stop_codon:yes gene_type:complete
MLLRTILKKNIIATTIIFFVLVYILINYLKPAFLYTHNGTLRQFGLGYKHKTIIPLWLLSIVIAIISYLIVQFYVVYPKINI